MSPPIATTSSSSSGLVAPAQPVNMLTSMLMTSSSSLSSNSSLTDFDFIFNETNMISFNNENNLSFGESAGLHHQHQHHHHHLTDSSIFGSSPPTSLSLSPLNGNGSSSNGHVHHHHHHNQHHHHHQHPVQQTIQHHYHESVPQSSHGPINIVNSAAAANAQSAGNLSSSGNFSFNSSDLESVAAAFSFDKLNNSFSNGTLLDICNGLDSFSNSLTGSFSNNNNNNNQSNVTTTSPATTTSAPPPATTMTTSATTSSFANYNSCSSYSMNNFNANFLSFGLFDEDDDYENENNAKEVDSEHELDLHGHDYDCLGADVAACFNGATFGSNSDSATIAASEAVGGGGFEEKHATSTSTSTADQLNDSDTLIAIREMAIKEKIQYQQQQQHRKHKNSTSSVSSITNIKKVAIELKQSASQVAYSSAAAAAAAAAVVAQPSATHTTTFKTSLSLDDLNDEFYDATTASNTSGMATSASANDLQPFLDIDDWEQMLDEDCISRLTNEMPPSAVAAAPTATANSSTCVNVSTGQKTKAPIIISNGTAMSSSMSTPTLSVTPLKLPTTIISAAKPAMASSSSSGALAAKPPQPVVVYLNGAGSTTTSSLTQIVPSASSTTTTTTTTTIHIKQEAGPKRGPVAKTSPTTTAISGQAKKVASFQETTAAAAANGGQTTTIISTASKMPANMLKRFNSVIINDARLSNDAKTNAGLAAAATVGRKGAKAGQSMSITATALNGDKAKPKTMTTTTAATTTSTVTNAYNAAKLTISTAPASTNAASSSSSNSTAQAAPASAGSLIDHCEIIDCVNPDQIFPCRPTFRYAKPESDEYHGSGGHHHFSFYKGAKMNSVDDEDDEEEEIDVVSVNAAGSQNHQLLAAQYQSSSSSTSSASNVISSAGQSAYMVTNNSNHNHHNYYYQPVGGSATTAAGRRADGAPGVKTNQVVFIKNENHEQQASPSLLAKYLKSNPSAAGTSTSASTGAPFVSYQSKQGALAAGKLVPAHVNTSSSSSGNKSVSSSSSSSSSSSNVSNVSSIENSINATATGYNKTSPPPRSAVVKTEPATKAPVRNRKAAAATAAPTPAATTMAQQTAPAISFLAGATIKPAIKTTQPLLHSSQFKLAEPTTTTTTTAGGLTKYVTMTATKIASPASTSKPATKVITTTTAPFTMLNHQSTAASFGHHYSTTTTTTLTGGSGGAFNGAKPPIIGGISSIKTFASKKLIPRINLPSLSSSQVLHETTSSSVEEINKLFHTTSHLKNATTTGAVTLAAPTVASTNAVVRSGPAACGGLDKRPAATTATTAAAAASVGRGRNKNQRPAGLAGRRRQRQRPGLAAENHNNSVDDEDIANYIEDTESLNNFCSNLDLLGANGRDSFDVDSAVDDDDDSLDDDDDDELSDDDDDDDDDEDDYSSSMLSPSCSSRNASSPLTSSNISSLSSGSNCSTPTKSAHGNKKHQLTKSLKHKRGDSSVDMDVLNERLHKRAVAKALKSGHQTGNNLSSLSSLGSSVSISSASSNNSPNNGAAAGNVSSSKRAHRHQPMGYMSDNPAEKRAFHILSERQRRNDLKKLFETLRTNIPSLCDKQKASKLTILKAAVDHLADVAQKKEKLSSTYEKEKQKQAQLLQHLKALQAQQYTSNYHGASSSSSSASASSTSTIVMNGSSIRMVVH